MKLLKNKVVLILLVLLMVQFYEGCKSHNAIVELPIARKDNGVIESVVFQPLSESSSTDASKIIAAYNSRNVGSPGWRQVVMELFSDGNVSRTFNVINLWTVREGIVNTLFVLEAPKALSGTNYLLRESASEKPEMRVNLFLPAGERRVLEVATNNFDEGLLGSDFSYNDIRMQLPLVGYRYTLISEGVLHKEPVWVVRVVSSDSQSREIAPWDRADLYIHRNFPFLLGADYYRNSEAAATEPVILKQMRVDNLKQINGVWTAVHMTMFSGPNRRSELTLLDAEFNSDSFDQNLFSPDKLEFISDELRQGWRPKHSRN